MREEEERRRAKSDEEDARGLSADIGQMSRCMCKCRNEMLGAENPEPENQERRWTDSRHTTMNLHRNAYKYCTRIYTNTGGVVSERASGLVHGTA